MAKPKTSKRALQMRAYRAQLVTIPQPMADTLVDMLEREMASIKAAYNAYATLHPGTISLELMTAMQRRDHLATVLAKLKGES